MNKKDLLLWSDKTMDYYSKANLVTSKLNEFFESNVCIPKGVNRHPYADVLHEWVEDIAKEIEFEDDINRWKRFGGWSNYVFRIKPSEPAVAPKYKLGDKVTVTYNGDTFDTTITAVKDGKYFFDEKLYLPIERQDKQLKPSEPVYEWQWCVIMDNGTASIYGYHTEETINAIFKERSKFKIEETKRDRKCNNQ